MEKTLLVTRVRTIKNVDVTITNSMVLNSHVINFSTSAKQDGLILNTSVTIGYDAPWRTVHKLLIDAALECKTILNEPKPFVLQTALDDFYVHYEINAYTDQPQEMATTYSELHEKIQDKFNQAGVEIMQWDATPQAGFTTVTKPWLPIPPSSAQYNVEAESKDPNSILNTYKKLIALRKSEPALRDGIQVSVGNDPNVFAYLRKSGEETILVFLNMSAKQQTFECKPDQTLSSCAGQLQPLYSSTAVAAAVSLGKVVLPPFAALVAKVQ